MLTSFFNLLLLAFVNLSAAPGLSFELSKHLEEKYLKIPDCGPELCNHSAMTQKIRHCFRGQIIGKEGDVGLLYMEHDESNLLESTFVLRTNIKWERNRYVYLLFVYLDENDVLAIETVRPCMLGPLDISARITGKGEKIGRSIVSYSNKSPDDIAVKRTIPYRGTMQLAYDAIKADLLKVKFCQATPQSCNQWAYADDPQDSSSQSHPYPEESAINITPFQTTSSLYSPLGSPQPDFMYLSSPALSEFRPHPGNEVVERNDSTVDVDCGTLEPLDDLDCFEVSFQDPVGINGGVDVTIPMPRETQSLVCASDTSAGLPSRDPSLAGEISASLPGSRPAKRPRLNLMERQVFRTQDELIDALKCSIVELKMEIEKKDARIRDYEARIAKNREELRIFADKM